MWMWCIRKTIRNKKEALLTTKNIRVKIKEK